MRNILWIVLLLAVPATAQQPDFSNVQIKVTVGGRRRQHWSLNRCGRDSCSRR
jgi:hypothetical protein